MKILKKTVLMFSLLILFTGALTACHTVQGAGEDIQAGGHAITKAAS